jgi:hypothetical protein
MPFFFILPLWVLAVILGIVMLCIRSTRQAGVYILTVSTFATFASFVLSTAVLLVGAQTGTNAPGWSGLAVVAGYLAAIPIGGLAGAIVGLLMTRKVLAQLSR